MLIVFMGILLSLAYNIVLGIFKSYPMEIIFEENQFTINYSRGETKSIPYYAIKDIRYKCLNIQYMNRRNYGDSLVNLVG